MADNIIGFARALRAAGLPVGPGATIDALKALEVVGLDNRADVFAALESVFVKRHEHAAIFAQAFDLFFRVEQNWDQLVDAVPLPGQPEQKPPPPASRRVQEALSQRDLVQERETSAREMQLSVSDEEVLQSKDFAQMSAAEIDEVKRAIQRMTLPLAERPTRRFQPLRTGHKLDLRRTLRGSLRTGGEIVNLHRLGHIDKPVPIVALLDISGSMSEYTRLFLHFLHAVTDARKRVSVFLFGTRLTNITRALRARDPDDALARCSALVEDWSGGTRIAPSLHAFNKLWARRVLGQGAIVLLITDGLEREADDRLGFEMDRLRRSCRRLIWLNPLLRYSGFEPKAQGIKMMLPHVDEFRTVHNLKSIGDLIDALSSAPSRNRIDNRFAA
ncbi:MAG: VWA domain-containing protein [Xanthobacteraceae bacterium]